METIKTVSNIDNVFSLPKLVDVMVDDGAKWFKNEVEATQFIVGTLQREGILIEAAGDDMYEYVR